MLNFSIKIFFLFSFWFIIPEISFSQNIKIQSIIKLEESIPSECGIKALIDSEKIEMIVKIIKKNKQVYTFFQTTSLKKKPETVDILTDDLSIVNLINTKPQFNKNKIFFEGIADTDKVASFFQKFIVAGGKLRFNSEFFEIMGPLDSKVRLEYLFCTGEMFHPKYDK